MAAASLFHCAASHVVIPNFSSPCVAQSSRVHGGAGGVSSGASVGPDACGRACDRDGGRSGLVRLTRVRGVDDDGCCWVVSGAVGFCGERARALFITIPASSYQSTTVALHKRTHLPHLFWWHTVHTLLFSSSKQRFRRDAKLLGKVNYASSHHWKAGNLLQLFLHLVYFAWCC